MQFSLVGGEPKPKYLKDFSWEKSPFSRKFRKASTAEEFTAIWKLHVDPFLDKNSGEYRPIRASQDSATSQVITQSSANSQKSTQKRANAQLSGPPLELPPAKKQKFSSEDTEDREQDQRIDNCFVGKSVALTLVIDGRFH